MTHGQMENDRSAVRREGTAGNSRVHLAHISWGAVLAGTVVIIAFQLLLSLLGLAVGAEAVDPLGQRDPFARIRVGAGLWLLVQTVLAVTAGGWVAGRLSPREPTIDGALHGLLSWGTATIVSVYFIGTAVGALTSGSVGLLGRGLAVFGPMSAMESIGSSSEARVPSQGRMGDRLRRDAQRLLLDTQTAGPPQATGIGPTAGTTGAGTSPQTGAPTAAAQRLQDEALVARIVQVIADGTVDPVERETLIGVVAERGAMSRPDATAIVNRWQQAFERAAFIDERAAHDASLRDRELADNATRFIGQASRWILLSLAFGALCSAWGGAMGSRDIPRPVDRGPLGERRVLPPSASRPA